MKKDILKNTTLKIDKEEYKRRKRKSTISRIFRNREIYLMLIPVMAIYIIFSYLPMYGIVLAWKSYLPKKGIIGSPGVGWKWFIQFFTRPEMSRALKNTIVISLLNLVFGFPAPIILALLINEVKHEKFKKVVQWMVYLPYFINWVVIGGIVKQFTNADDGLINNIVAALGGERTNFLVYSRYFYTILILVSLWKGVGWGTVIYLAAFSNIDPTLYEAAKIDGCNRAQLVWHITVPAITPLVTTMLIMQIASIMNAGFDPIINLYNDSVKDVADTIDTFVFSTLTSSSAGSARAYGIATAVGLFKNVVNFVLLIFANYWTKKINGYSMYTLD